MAERPTPTDRQSAREPGKTRKVRMALMTCHAHGDGSATYRCNCEWSRFHVRAKVAERAAVDHVNAKHRGQAMWL